MGKWMGVGAVISIDSYCNTVVVIRQISLFRWKYMGHPFLLFCSEVTQKHANLFPSQILAHRFVPNIVVFQRRFALILYSGRLPCHLCFRRGKLISRNDLWNGLRVCFHFVYWSLWTLFEYWHSPSIMAETTSKVQYHTEIPPELKTLVTCVSRGFYPYEHAIVLDYLIHYPCLKASFDA